jgi:nicotinamide phosphoribosyltransferase
LADIRSGDIDWITNMNMDMEKSVIFRTDSYKWGHWRQYMPGTEGVYSYVESRNGAKFNDTVFFGLQYLLKAYLAGQVVTQEAIDEAASLSEAHLGPGRFNRDGWQYILDKHQGRLPVEQALTFTTSNTLNHSSSTITATATKPTG